MQQEHNPPSEPKTDKPMDPPVEGGEDEGATDKLSKRTANAGG